MAQRRYVLGLFVRGDARRRRGMLKAALCAMLLGLVGCVAFHVAVLREPQRDAEARTRGLGLSAASSLQTRFSRSVGRRSLR